MKESSNLFIPSVVFIEEFYPDKAYAMYEPIKNILNNEENFYLETDINLLNDNSQRNKYMEFYKRIFSHNKK
jgi:hypothetical protein